MFKSKLIENLFSSERVDKKSMGFKILRQNMINYVRSMGSKFDRLKILACRIIPSHLRLSQFAVVDRNDNFREKVPVRWEKLFRL